MTKTEQTIDFLNQLIKKKCDKMKYGDWTPRLKFVIFNKELVGLDYDAGDESVKFRAEDKT